MSDDNKIPTEDNITTSDEFDNDAVINEPAAQSPTNVNNERDDNARSDDPRMGERLERLGGEPAPVITPEEFARLQKAGQVHIDSRGRVRTSRRSDAEAGVSLRKRRAWYAHRQNR
jgi:hypothetical protein